MAVLVPDPKDSKNKMKGRHGGYTSSSSENSRETIPLQSWSDLSENDHRNSNLTKSKNIVKRYNSKEILSTEIDKQSQDLKSKVKQK